jgi:flagellar motility protein MotE (MotC chaperone)
MKTVWTIISILALANLLAVLGFVGWLGATQRLNKDRVEAVRLIFAQTTQQEQQAKDKVRAEGEQTVVKKAEADRIALPPIAAADKIKQQRVDSEIKLQSLQRRESEIKGLQVWLQRENDRLQKWQTDLQAREGAFAAERKRIADTDGTEQFKKVLTVLTGVKPKEAQTMLSQMLSQGKNDEVIGYLNAMEERTRSKVIAEFSKADPKVAADLLERLRTRGIIAAAPEATGK